MRFMLLIKSAIVHDGYTQISADEDASTVGGSGCKPTIPCVKQNDQGKLRTFTGKRKFASIRMFPTHCEISAEHAMCVKVDGVFVNVNRPFVIRDLAVDKTAKLVVGDKETFEFDLKFVEDSTPVTPARPVVQARPASGGTGSLEIEQFDPYEAWKAMPDGSAAAPSVVYRSHEDEQWKYAVVPPSLTLGRDLFKGQVGNNFAFSQVAIKLTDVSCTKVIFPGKNGYALNGDLILRHESDEHDIGPTDQVTLLSAWGQYHMFFGTAPAVRPRAMEPQQTLVFDYGVLHGAAAADEEDPQTQVFDHPPAPVRRRLPEGREDVRRQLPAFVAAAAARAARSVRPSGGTLSNSMPCGREGDEEEGHPGSPESDAEHERRARHGNWSDNDGAM